MAIPAAISLVTLGVRDLGAATSFYETLGFPLSSASVPGEVSFFRSAGGLLGLYGNDDLADDAQLPRAAQDKVQGFRGVTLAVNVSSRDAVDDAVRAAETAGATVLKPAQQTEWGGYHAYFADLDGHVWEVAHNPGWPLGDNGLPVLPR